MKFPIAFFLVCLLLVSCTNKESVKITAASPPKKEESQDPRTKVERDSIRIMNAVKILNVVRESPVIDPKKIDRAPFKSMDFDKVVAYSYDGSHEQLKIAPGIGKTRASSMKIDLQKGLTQEQANSILSLFTYKTTYDPMAAMGCFEPRFALVLYKGEKSVMQISVCLDCNNTSSVPQLQAMGDGLSKKGRKAIIALCKELGFPYGELKN